MGGKYHFVCHDCTEEGVYSDHTEALSARDSHVDRTDHRVSVGKISDQVA